MLIEVTGCANEPETYDEFVALCREVRSFARTQKRTLFPIAASGTGDVLLRRLLTSQTQRTMLGRVSEGGNITDLAFGLTRQSKHKETALDFLRFLSSQGVNQKFARLSGRLPAVVGVEPNSEMAGFMPVLSGYPSGYSPESAGGSARSLLRSNLYRLWDDSEGIDKFLEVMNAGFEEAVLHKINFELRQKASASRSRMSGWPVTGCSDCASRGSIERGIEPAIPFT